MIFNFNAYSFSKFIKFRKRSNKIDVFESAGFSNNALAKYNPNSIPNRRKQQLYKKQETMKSNMEIKFDNSEWLRHSIISNSPSDLDGFNGNIPENSMINTEYKSRVKDKYRGHGAERVQIKIFSIIFVLFSILLHYFVIFMTEVFENQDNKDFRFNVIHGLLLFQWVLCLTFMITWYQNYRFEYAIDKLLADGYSLYYLMRDKKAKLELNESLNEIGQEMKTLAMHVRSASVNDMNLPTPTPSNQNSFVSSFNVNGHKGTEEALYEANEEEEEYSEITNPDDIVEDVDYFKKTVAMNNVRTTKCCKCLRFFSVGILRLIIYLPYIVLINGICWAIHGIYICDIEIIWLQHAISIGVSGLYILFSLCMNERHLILSKESQVMDMKHDEIGEAQKKKRKLSFKKKKIEQVKQELPNKSSPIKPLPPSPINIR